MLPSKSMAMEASDSKPVGTEELEKFIWSLKNATIRTGPDPNTPPLIRAAADGDVRTMSQLLVNADGLNARNVGGQTPLHWAVTRGDNVVLHLLELSRRDGPQFELDAADPRGRTALHYAAITRNQFAVRLLLLSGFSVNWRDVDGQTPLMKAASCDDRALCRALLNVGAEVAAADAAGRTALHVAAAGDCAATVGLLLAHGAQLGAVDAEGETALWHALRHSAQAAAGALLPTASFTPHVDSMGRTELHWAAANGSERIVDRLLQFGPPSWPCDNEGMTAVLCAIQARNGPTAKMLLRKPSCNEQQCDLSGRNALHWAAYCGRSGDVEHLLKAGWWAWRPDRDGRDVLMLALTGSDKRTVLMVLHHAGFQQLADLSGQTALHYAAMHADAEVVLALLQRGAEANAVDSYGWTPLGRARHRRENAVTLEILSCCTTINVE